MLLPEHRLVSADALAELYEWPASRWVRASMVLTLDGRAAGEDGVSGSISSPTDRRVFATLRSMADAYLVGAQTVRAEQYTPVVAKPEFAHARLALGQLPAPTLVIVSGSCAFDWDTSDFARSDNAPIIITSASSSRSRRDQAEAAGCRVLVAGDDAVDLTQALDALAERGLNRIICEGGPSLLAQMSSAGLLDEVDLTLSPMLIGVQPTGVQPAPALSPDGSSDSGRDRADHANGLASLRHLRLVHLLEHDGYMFARYITGKSEK